MSKIIKCNCESEFQDKQYGFKNRIHIEGIKGLTCTVCGNKTNDDNIKKSSYKKK